MTVIACTLMISAALFFAVSFAQGNLMDAVYGVICFLIFAVWVVKRVTR